MITREILPEEKAQFNAVATHPLQSWEWGEFRKETGKKVIRLGSFTEKELKIGYQLFIHPLPWFPYNVIYFPKGPMPDELMLKALAKIGLQNKAILVKLEPNVGGTVGLGSEGSQKGQGPNSRDEQRYKDTEDFLRKNGCRPGQSVFTKYTFQLDLAKTEDQLLAAMKSKTRYNIRLAQRHGVEVIEDNSSEAFETYLQLMIETTKRQGFYAHTPDYHQKMWKILNPAGIAHLLLAKYKGRILVAWVLFTFNNILYYPYGASTREHREVMPSYAMMWEAIKFGQKMNCKKFDLWGTPGPNPDPKDPWYGFHRFKEGFGAQLVEFIGTWDLVIDYRLYPFYNLAQNLRWKFLRLKAKLR